MNYNDELIKLYYETKNIKLIEKIMRLNLDLIEHAIKYMNSSLSYDELFCYGLECLYRAIKSYNPKQGVFNSYASVCIRNEMLREIARDANTGIIFYPKFYMAKKEVEKEMLESLEENNDLIDDIFNYLVKNKMISENSSEVHKKRVLINLKNYLEDYILIDNNLLDYEIEYNTINERINKILNILGFRNKEILKAYFGLGEKKELTYDEISDIFQLSKSRVGQIISESLTILRNSEYKKELEEYLVFFNNYHDNTLKKRI